MMTLARVGMTTRRIGAELKIGASTVSRDVKARLKSTRSNARTPSKCGSREIDRLDALLTVWWVKAGEDLHSLDRVLKIQGATGAAARHRAAQACPALRERQHGQCHHGGHAAGIGL